MLKSKIASQFDPKDFLNKKLNEIKKEVSQEKDESEDNVLEKELILPKRFKDLVSEENPFGYVDVVTFCEDEYFLGSFGLKLTPWQKVILNC